MDVDRKMELRLFFGASVRADTLIKHQDTTQIEPPQRYPSREIPAATICCFRSASNLPLQKPLQEIETITVTLQLPHFPRATILPP